MKLGAANEGRKDTYSITNFLKEVNGMQVKEAYFSFPNIATQALRNSLG
jgi:hypothetical protein